MPKKKSAIKRSVFIDWADCINGSLLCQVLSDVIATEPNDKVTPNMVSDMITLSEISVNMPQKPSFSEQLTAFGTIVLSDQMEDADFVRQGLTKHPYLLERYKFYIDQLEVYAAQKLKLKNLLGPIRTSIENALNRLSIEQGLPCLFIDFTHSLFKSNAGEYNIGSGTIYLPMSHVIGAVSGSELIASIAHEYAHHQLYSLAIAGAIEDVMGIKQKPLTLTHLKAIRNNFIVYQEYPNASLLTDNRINAVDKARQRRPLSKKERQKTEMIKQNAKIMVGVDTEFKLSKIIAAKDKLELDGDLPATIDELREAYYLDNDNTAPHAVSLLLKENVIKKWPIIDHRPLKAEDYQFAQGKEPKDLIDNLILYLNTEESRLEKQAESDWLNYYENNPIETEAGKVEKEAKSGSYTITTEEEQDDFYRNHKQSF